MIRKAPHFLAAQSSCWPHSVTSGEGDDFSSESAEEPICDHELDLLERKTTLLKQQKRGLMQQLLTGRVRVSV